MEHESIGYTASAFHIISIIPEIYYAVKTDGTGISIYFILLQIISTIIFIAYEYLIYEIPLIVADTCLLTELLILLGLKLKYNKKKLKCEPNNSKMITMV
tara:strand:- start:2093 stop:2392 length:300 start_codon:yes stop_codon:yes gene_type:complete